MSARACPKYQPATRLASKSEASLDAALIEMEAGGDRALALEHLLGVWRSTRAPSIADVIDLLSDELAAKQAPIHAVGSTSGKQMWNRIANEGAPETLSRLLEALPDNQDRFLRLQTLIADGEPDPRFGTFARRWFEAPPVKGSKRAPFFLHVVELLEKTNDARILDRLRVMTEAEHRSRTIASCGLRAWKPLQDLVKHLEGIKVKSLSPADEETLAKIRAKLVAATSGRATSADDPAPFFARVYADPNDIEARAVLSDLLLQRGDPRGEFIALQLARAESGSARRTSREAELEDQWGRLWLGATEPCIQQGGVVFERGFLSACRYTGRGGEDVSGCDEWTTVTSIDCSHASSYVGGSRSLLSSSKMKSLRHVVGISAEDVAYFVQRGTQAPVVWETLGLRLWRFSDAMALASPEARRAFPHITKLLLAPSWNETFDDCEVENALSILKNWARTLTAFSLSLEPRRLSQLALAPEIKTLDELVLHMGKKATFELHPKERRVRVVLDQLREETVTQVATQLRTLGAAKLFAEARVDVDGRPKLEKDKLKRGRYEAVDIKPLRAAAKDVGIDLQLLI